MHDFVLKSSSQWCTHSSLKRTASDVLALNTYTKCQLFCMEDCSCLLRVSVDAYCVCFCAVSTCNCVCGLVVVVVVVVCVCVCVWALR